VETEIREIDNVANLIFTEQNDSIGDFFSSKNELSINRKI
jgi:hypothetical protein